MMEILCNCIKNNRAAYECRCDCGKLTIVRVDHYKSGRIRSCGCLVGRSIKHGLYRHSLYKKWSNIQQRTENRKHNRYKYYGGKGITMCKEWRDHPDSFVKWAIDNGWEEGTDIHRKEADKNYSPDNCMFLTPSAHRAIHIEKNKRD